MSAMTIEAGDQEAIVRDAEAAVGRIAEARAEIGRVIFGQAAVVERTLVTLLSGGHGLLVGVRGLAIEGWPKRYLFSRSRTIAGGTAQIRRNIIGERLLGLPRGR